MKQILIVLISISLSSRVHSQLADSLLFLPEQLIQEEADEQSLDDHYRQLQELAENPVNIHSADLKILIELQLMTELQLFYLRAYLQHHAQLNSIYELEYIDGFTAEDVERLKVFVEVKPLNNRVNQLNKRSKKLYGQISLASNASTEAADTSLLGSKTGLKISGSLKLGKNWQAGFLGEKDPGEQILFSSKQTGLDHYAGYLRYLSPSGAWQYIVGNFKLITGQGAGYSSAGMNFISMEQPSAVKRFHRGFRPYAGTEENNQLQGAAVSYQNPAFEAGLYASSHYRDAIADSNQTITSLTASGNHSDSTSFARRKSVQENRAGVFLLIKLTKIYIGIHTDLLMYPLVLQSRQDVLLPANTAFLSGSMDYQFPLRRAHLFGEFAMRPDGLLQQIHGLEFNPVSSLQLGMKYSLSGRKSIAMNLADRQLQAVTGDQGFMLGIGWSASRLLRFSFSGEWQQRRLHDSSLDAPAMQSGLQFRISYTPGRHSQVFLQLRNNFKETGDSNDSYFTFPEKSRSSYQLRLQARHNLSESVTLLLRFDQQAVYAGEGTPLHGSLLVQGIQWNYQNKLAVHIRYMLYLTDSYETAFRISETDLPGYYSSANLSGRGNRYYIMVKYQVNPGWSLAFKWSQTLQLTGYTSASEKSDAPAYSAGEIKVMIRFRINPIEKEKPD